MRTITMLVLLFALVAATAGAEDASLFREVGVVPTFYHGLLLQTGDPLVVTHTRTETTVEFDLSAAYSLAFESERWRLTASNDLELALVDPIEQSSATNAVATGVTFYLNRPLPFPVQVFAGGRLEPGVMSTTEQESLIDSTDPGVTLPADWFAGAGLGRVVNVTAVADAIAIADNLGLDPSHEQLLAVARIVGMRSEYRYRNRGDYEEAYYGDIAAALGVPDRALAVQRAARDTLTVSTRLVGWEVTAGFHRSFRETELQPGWLEVRATAGLPLGLAVQVIPRLDLWYELERSDLYTMFSARCTADHSRRWSTSLSAGVVVPPSAGAGAGRQDVDFDVELGTRFRAWERSYVDASLAADWTSGDASPELRLSVSFWFELL